MKRSGTRTISYAIFYAAAPAFRVHDKVGVNNGTLVPYS